MDTRKLHGMTLLLSLCNSVVMAAPSYTNPDRISTATERAQKGRPDAVHRGGHPHLGRVPDTNRTMTGNIPLADRTGPDVATVPLDADAEMPVSPSVHHGKTP